MKPWKMGLTTFACMLALHALYIASGWYFQGINHLAPVDLADHLGLDIGIGLASYTTAKGTIRNFFLGLYAVRAAPSSGRK